MSGQFSATVMFVSLVAIAIAANRAEDVGSVGSGELKRARGPAAVESLRKVAVLNSNVLAEPLLTHTEKLHGPLQVVLEIVGPRPLQIGDVFVLRGTISARQAVDGTKFTWILPAGVEMVNGPREGHLDYVSSTQPGQVEITLRKTASENRQVHLQAVASNGPQYFGDSAQFNTDSQDAIDAQKAEMKKATAADAERLKDVKIYH